MPALTVQAAEESGFTTLSVKAVKEVVSMGPRVSLCMDVSVVGSVAIGQFTCRPITPNAAG